MKALSTVFAFSAVYRRGSRSLVNSHPCGKTGRKDGAPSVFDMGPKFPRFQKRDLGHLVSSLTIGAAEVVTFFAVLREIEAGGFVFR